MNRFKKVLPVLVAVVLLAGSAAPAFAAGPPEGKGQPGPTIVDVAIAVNSDGPFAGEFDILIAAVSATPRVLNTLNGNGQFTVFAPTDAAFEALAGELGLSLEELVTFLLENPEYLEEVLLYHVARGRRYAEDVLASARIRTLQGGFLLQSGGFLTDNLDRPAEIIVTDVEAGNGIIHAIDAVVLPFAP